MSACNSVSMLPSLESMVNSRRRSSSVACSSAEPLDASAPLPFMEAIRFRRSSAATITERATAPARLPSWIDVTMNALFVMARRPAPTGS